MAYIDKSLEYVVEYRDTSLNHEILSKELIQDHLVLVDSEDNLLSYYRDAAIESAERLMNRPIVPSKISLMANSMEFRLPYGGYNIYNFFDAVGKQIEFRFNPVSKKVQILTNERDVTFPVSVMANCDFFGNGDGNIPNTIIHGLLMSMATMYQNRESIVLGISANEIPYSHKAIFMQWRFPPNVGGL